MLRLFNSRLKKTLAGLTFLSLLLLIPINTGGDVFLWGPVFDAGHFTLFFLLALGTNWLFPSGLLPKRIDNSYIIAAAASVVAEIIQPLTGRSASLIDIANGCLGIFGAWCLIEVWDKFKKVSLVLATLAGCGLAQLALLYPVLDALEARNWRKSNLPNLSDFETEIQELLWHNGLPKSDSPTRDQVYRGRKLEFVTSEIPSKALVGRSKPGLFRGITYCAGDLDWSIYKRLEFSISNNGQPFELHIRVDDAIRNKLPTDRFEKKLSIAHGHQTIQIPLEEVQRGPAQRQLDLTQIRNLSFFTPPEALDIKYLVDNLKLIAE